MTHLEFHCSDEKATALLKAARLYDEGVELEPVRHAKVLYNVAIEKEECCGYKKRKGLVLQKYTCSSCYTAIPGESKFCMECGAKLIWRNEDEN